MTSSISELVDAIHVALGLRLEAIVLGGQADRADRPISLLIVAQDLPSAMDQRLEYLLHRMPTGILDGVTILLRTPNEMEANPISSNHQFSSGARVLLDASGLVSRQMKAISETPSG
jgi:hypothetical protein